nr:MAG TPA: hypothetical protein [Caudoviricetes sp.]
MWVDIDDVRAELERSYRKYEEELRGEKDMKNREKFREELIKCAKTPEERLNVCEFIRINVLPHFGVRDCVGVNCAWCKFLVDMWMDAEYEEPPKPETDWSKVPVDTLVRVRDLESQEWTLRYFKGIDDEDYANRFLAWVDGATSKTAYEEYESWTYCELVEVPNDK